MAAGRAAGRAVAGLWRAASASRASGAAGAAGARLTTDRSGPPRVVFLGPPGVGKGTYAGRVAAKVRWCRWWPLRVQKAGQED